MVIHVQYFIESRKVLKDKAENSEAKEAATKVQ